MIPAAPVTAATLPFGRIRSGIGVFVSFWLIRLSRILLGSAGSARTLIGTDYFIWNTG
jgi:hypothetical protein